MKYLLIIVGTAASLWAGAALAAGEGRGGCGDGNCFVGNTDQPAGHIVITSSVGDVTGVTTYSLGLGKQGGGGHVTIVLTTDGQVTCTGFSSGGFGVGGGHLKLTTSGDCP